MNNELIGKKIRMAREEKGITQEELAEKMDLSVSFLCQVECGKKKFSLKRLVEVSNILEKPINYFIEGYEIKNNGTVNEIVTVFSKMSNSKQKLSLQIIKVLYDAGKIE